MNVEINQKPTVNITINKGRVKKHLQKDVNVCYLENNTEFQIELYNPTQSVILAKILLNGNSISNGGIVLRPAERIFLDRFIDVPKKFKYETYSVQNNTLNKKSIENNGKVEVSFYYESDFPSNFFDTYWRPQQTFIYPQSPSCDPSFPLLNRDYFINSTNTSNLNDIIGSVLTTNSTLNTNFTYLSNSDIETGRIEKGSISKQEFENSDREFYSCSFHTVIYEIKPYSEKIIAKGDLKNKKYCTECGKKIKQSDKYCSHCGHKQ